MYIYMYMYTYIYIYIYMYRERERYTHMCVYICIEREIDIDIDTYIYIYVYLSRYRYSYRYRYRYIHIDTSPAVLARSKILRARGAARLRTKWRPNRAKSCRGRCTRAPRGSRGEMGSCWRLAYHRMMLMLVCVGLALICPAPERSGMP